MYNTGIYFIINIENGYFYIGSSNDLWGRWLEHHSALRLGNHFNGRLQNAWNKYGEEAFKFTHILYCNEFNLEFYEQKFLDKYWGTPQCYNISKCVAANMRGRKHSEISKELMSKAHMGKRLTDSHRENISKGNMGKKMSDGACAKISKARKGMKFSEEHKNNIRVSKKNNPYKHSLESRRKISIANSSSDHTWVKLNKDNVLEIRAALARGEKGCVLAKKYNVAKTTISMIKVGKTWKYV